MIEATIVLPFVIFVILFLLAVTVHFAQITFDEINANSFIMKILGEENKNRYTDYFGKSFLQNKSIDNFHKVRSISVEKGVKFIGFSIESNSRDVVRKYNINERKLILYKDVLHKDT